MPDGGVTHDIQTKPRLLLEEVGETQYNTSVRIGIQPLPAGPIPPSPSIGTLLNTIRISDIVVGKRYRKDLGDIPALAADIERLGLLQPTVVDKNHNLIAGLW